MNAKKIFFIILFLLLIIGVGVASYGAYYFYSQYQSLKENPEMVAQEEERIVLESLSKLIELPEGETPSIATILDIEKLMDQPFFAKANNGDKIIIYSQARKAILWRPSSNKIIEVAPLVYDQNQEEGVTTPRPTPSPDISPFIEEESDETEPEVEPTQVP